LPSREADRQASSPNATRIVITAGALNTFASLPRFLCGALAVLISDELGLTPTQIGAAISTVVAVSSVGSIWGGRIVQRVGASRGMVLVATLSALVHLGIAVQATTYRALLGWMVLSGTAMALVHPAAALAISGSVSPNRQGFAFGVKQSAPTTGSLLAGFAVPALGLTVGWRWAYIAGAAGAALVALSVPRGAGRTARRDGRAEIRSGMTTLMMLAVGMGFATAAVAALSAFYVLSAVHHGIDVGVAGLWLAVGSVAFIGARLSAGWLADRREGGSLRVVSQMMVVGTVGFILLAQSRGVALFALATLLAFAAGWGWPGLFQLTVTRQNAEAPAAATGITQTGAFVGSAIGPLGFGWLVELFSYTVAWWAAAGGLLVGSLVMVVSRRFLMAERTRS
jgi:predicted MFS family arabinose efflux permease